MGPYLLTDTLERVQQLQNLSMLCVHCLVHDAVGKELRPAPWHSLCSHRKYAGSNGGLGLQETTGHSTPTPSSLWYGVLFGVVVQELHHNNKCNNLNKRECK